MINKKFAKEWLLKAGNRAIRTAAQVAIASIGTAQVMNDVNWTLMGSTVIVSTILSLLTSVASLPEFDKESFLVEDEDNE